MKLILSWHEVPESNYLVSMKRVGERYYTFVRSFLQNFARSLELNVMAGQSEILVEHVPLKGVEGAPERGEIVKVQFEAGVSVVLREIEVLPEVLRVKVKGEPRWWGVLERKGESGAWTEESRVRLDDGGEGEFTTTDRVKAFRVSPMQASAEAW